MDFKDYYAILGVEPGADKAAIKTAYRKLARKYHPDVSQLPDAENKFKEVAEAYDVLHDDAKRAEYDELRTYGGRRQQGQGFEPPPGWQSTSGSAQSSADFSDFFNSIFGGAAGGASGGAHHQRGSNVFRQKGQDIELELPIFLEDTLSEEGKAVEYRVPAVDASGRVTEVKKSLKVKIPAGVTEGERIRLKGQGAPGYDGGEQGDLYLHIRLVPHPLFDVEGHNLIIAVPVSPWEAALGTKVTMPTLTGKIQMSIPPHSQTGQRLRVKGKGLVSKTGMGDLYAVIKVVMPEKSSDETHKLWQQLAETAAFDPRTQWNEFTGASSND